MVEGQKEVGGVNRKPLPTPPAAAESRARAARGSESAIGGPARQK